MKSAYVEDRELVRRLLAGDERGFRLFFDDYFGRLFRFSLPRMRFDETAAEDVVQETLTRAISKLHTYRGEASLFAWLCTFCRHEISRYYHVHGGGLSTVELIEDSPEVRAALDTLTGQASPWDQLTQQELARHVHVALDHLPAHYADCLEWKYSQDLPVKVIAERLGIGPKAAESLLTRARQAFREGFAALAERYKVIDGRNT
jgi:RNA polymerase sigma-70 factor (ECF subfamily)